MEEKRKSKRFTFKRGRAPFLEMKVKKGEEIYEDYTLTVRDASERGLGVVVPEKDFEILDTVMRGNLLEEMIFFSPWKVRPLEGIVRHKTRIHKGAYKGCYVIGIRSTHSLQDCCSDPES